MTDSELRRLGEFFVALRKTIDSKASPEVAAGIWEHVEALAYEIIDHGRVLKPDERSKLAD